jgi:hypothetical protein
VSSESDSEPERREVKSPKESDKTVSNLFPDEMGTDQEDIGNTCIVQEFE